MKNKDSRPFPIDPDEFRSGVTIDAQSGEPEPLGQVSDTALTQSPLPELITNLAARSATFGTSEANQVIAASVQHFEQELSLKSSELSTANRKIEQLQDERTNDKVVIAKQTGEITKLNTISRVSAVIYLVAAAMISIGVSDFSNNSGKVVFGLGVLLVVIAFFAPFLGGSKND